MNGLGLKDFDTRKEAMETADQLIAQSVKEYGHKYACISYGNELTDKFFYVLQGGRTKTWYKDENKTLESTKNPKNAKMLADQGMFAELLGAEADAASSCLLARRCSICLPPPVIMVSGMASARKS